MQARCARFLPGVNQTKRNNRDSSLRWRSTQNDWGIIFGGFPKDQYLTVSSVVLIKLRIQKRNIPSTPSHPGRVTFGVGIRSHK